jgi:hypothetical protein
MSKSLSHPVSRESRWSVTQILAIYPETVGRGRPRPNPVGQPDSPCDCTFGSRENGIACRFIFFSSLRPVHGLRSACFLLPPPCQTRVRATIRIEKPWRGGASRDRPPSDPAEALDTESGPSLCLESSVRHHCERIQGRGESRDAIQWIALPDFSRSPPLDGDEPDGLRPGEFGASLRVRNPTQRF